MGKKPVFGLAGLFLAGVTLSSGCCWDQNCCRGGGKSCPAPAGSTVAPLAGGLHQPQAWNNATRGPAGPTPGGADMLSHQSPPPSPPTLTPEGGSPVRPTGNYGNDQPITPARFTTPAVPERPPLPVPGRPAADADGYGMAPTGRSTVVPEEPVRHPTLSAPIPAGNVPPAPPPSSVSPMPIDPPPPVPPGEHASQSQYPGSHQIPIPPPPAGVPAVPTITPGMND